jgi:hypothetical protein
MKLRFGAYLNATALPPLPATFGHDTLISTWGVLGNDDYGDCVWAGAAHETILLTTEAGNGATFTDTSVLSDYTAVTGFNPNDPSTDNGTDMQVAAEYRRTTGILDANGNRHKIAAYLALEPGNLTDLYLAAYLFNAVGIGIKFPNSADTQFDAGKSWDVVPGAVIVGGHYIPLLARRADGLHIITWGRNQVMTENFLKTYCDEAVAYVSKENLINQKSPDGFAYNDLISDLAAL